eukprot:gene18605-22264_t
MNTLANYIGVLLLLSVVVHTQPLPIPVAGPHLVPQPQFILFGTVNMTIDPSKFRIETTSSSEILNIVIKRYQELVLFTFGKGSHVADNHMTLTVSVASDSEDLVLGVSENYTLSVDGEQLEIAADTVFGAVRALETFSQLISYGEMTDIYTINYAPVVIKDYPRFPWRGLMIDAASHYLPASFIMHILDSMSWVKFNVLHIHFTSGDSFTVESATFPNITTDGAFNPVAVYSSDDIEEIIAYGKVLGIRIIPEFDVPGHSLSWTKAFPDTLTNCPGIANPLYAPFSPASESTLPVIDGVFNDMFKIFDSQHFHVGGDEVVLRCWANDHKVLAWMNSHNYTTLQTEQYFIDHISETLDTAGRTMIAWNDLFSNGMEMDPSTIIQVWDSAELTNKIVSAGYQAITSYNYYLNLQVPVGIEYYEFVDTWQGMYQNISDPHFNITNNQHLVLGGEGLIWGNKVDISNVDGFLWPRAIGLAERFWSDRNVDDISNALTRFGEHICRISARGTASGPLFPDWCASTFFFQTIDFMNPIQRLSTQQIHSILGKQ